MTEIQSNEQLQQNFFGERLVVANVGIKPFYDSLKSLDVPVVQVDWIIPAGGDQQVLDLLDQFI